MQQYDEGPREFDGDSEPDSPPSDAQLQEWIAQIQSGERGDEIDGLSRVILRDFILRQYLGVSHSPITLDWIAEVFSTILDHEDPLETLGLKPRPKHRPPDPQHGWHVACRVKAAQERGYSRAEAVNAASDLFHLDESAVRRMVKKDPEWTNSKANWEAHFLQALRPLPPRRTDRR